MVRISCVILLALLVATSAKKASLLDDVRKEIAAMPAGVLGKGEQLHAAEARPVAYGQLRGSSALEQNSSKKADVYETRAPDRKEPLTAEAILFLRKLIGNKWDCGLDEIKYEIDLRLDNEECLREGVESSCKVKGKISSLFDVKGKYATPDRAECLWDWEDGCDVSVTGGQGSVEFTILENHYTHAPPAVKGKILWGGNPGKGEQIVEHMQLKLTTLKSQKEELFQCEVSKDEELPTVSKDEELPTMQEMQQIIKELEETDAKIKARIHKAGLDTAQIEANQRKIEQKAQEVASLERELEETSK